MRSVILLTALLMTAACEGTSGGLSSSRATFDCGSPPADAVTSVPRPFDRYAVIECFEYGQWIFSVESDLWIYPGGGQTLPTVTAADPELSLDDPRASQHAYFTGLIEREPDPGDLSWLNEQRRRYGIEDPDRLISLYATTNQGATRALFLGLKNGRQRPSFGFWCRGPCADTPEDSIYGNPFMVMPALPRIR